MPSAEVNVLEGVIAAAIFGVIMLILGAALRHWLRSFKESIEVDLKRIGGHTQQLERNGGSHLADAVWDTKDRLDDHMSEAAKDRRRLARLERQLTRHIAENHTSEDDAE